MRMDRSSEAIHSKRFISNVREATPRNFSRLEIGDSVILQNQHGNNPNQWQKTGRIVETSAHRKYRVLVDGSRHTTTRNRKFIRKIPDSFRESTDLIIPNVPQPNTVNLPPTAIQPDNTGMPQEPTADLEEPSQTTSPATNDQNQQDTGESTDMPNVSQLHLRFSTRIRRPPARLKDYILD